MAAKWQMSAQATYASGVGKFVGRSRETELLAAVTRGALRGGVAAAVVMGDPGSGKTRLLAEAVSGAAIGRRFRVVGYESEQHVPLAAAADLLRKLGTGGNSLLERALHGGHESSALEPIRIFEAAHRAVRELVPVLLVVDDLQWADELSRALLHYLTRGAEAEGGQLAILVAARPGPIATAFADSLAHALPAEGFTALELGPLGREESVELAMALAPDLDESRAVEIWERSGGVPFWLETLARSAEHATDVGRLVSARLRGASADSAAMLAVLVAAARPLPQGALAELGEWPPERAEHAVAELVGRGIATSSGTAVRPAHDLIREAALAVLPAETRRDAHRRLAGWLERQGSDLQTLREATEHRRHGAMPVFEQVLQLALHPQRRLLGREGLLWLLVLAKAGESAADSGVLHAALATLATELGENGLAEERWAAVAEGEGDRGERARAALEAARAAYLADRRDAAWRFVTRARALCTDEALAIEIDAHEAAVRRWLDHDVDEARALTGRALAAASALTENAGGVETLDRAGLAAVHEALSAGVDDALVADDNRSGLALTYRLVEVAHRLGEEQRLRALLKHANMLSLAGRLPEAEEDLHSAWSAAHERILPTLEIEAGFALASALLALGRLEEAERISADTAALASRGSSPSRMFATPWRLQMLPLFIRLSRGDWRRAVEELRGAARDERDPHRRLHLQQTIGSWLSRVAPEPSRDEVASRFSAAQADADAARCRRCRGEVDLRAAEALARVGLFEDARAIVRACDADPVERGPLSGFLRRRAESALAVASGEERRACALLEELAGTADALGLRLERVWISLDLGSALAAFDRDRAVEVLRRTAEEAESMGARSQCALARQRLRSLGVRTWRRGGAEGGLTERELQVARLVATGASNPEIASALFLSRKTIERHVSNILRKLGARNRAELASRLRELEQVVEGAHR